MLWRLFAILPKKAKGRRRTKNASDTCSLAVFLGSGGHTSEALALISTLDFIRYSPRKYIVSEGDSLSAQKVAELERELVRQKNLTGRPTAYEILIVPRARHVHQALMATPPTAIWSLISSLQQLMRIPLTAGEPFADVLLLNGPGTCCILCVAVYITRFCGLPAPRMIYVESFARINTLSLSGKLLRPFVDRFVVQWPQLLNDNGCGDCRGWLV
ncbi:glycosyltransferase family 1 protein [Phellopilus nigrolimitatus]|nr:glycosyltransferase family 1 protein [Phellopilus nigrolimitatus]